ncbi:MAG: DUF2804 domain-containing protein [Spirochaetales bacterium]|nr:DUF2804 domain-containing protein [Spirochaetales bacterium]
MIKLIGKDNRVNYGCIDELIEWNYRDFILRDFFEKEIRGLRKRRAYHQFNYIGISTGDYIAGFALVDLGLLHNAFSFLSRKGEGIIFQSNEKCLPFQKKLSFPRNPDRYRAAFRSSKSAVTIEKDHSRRRLVFDCIFEGRLELKGISPFSIEKQKPLRVLNPNDPNRFTFTEKFSPLVFDDVHLALDGKELDYNPDTVSAVYDWTGGYLKRETDWLWSSFSAVHPDGTTAGLNLAAFVNETYFSENAFWINGKRTRIPRVIYDYDSLNPSLPWKIHDEEGVVDLIFTPECERLEHFNGGPLLKTSFHQYIGSFSGTLRPKEGESAELKGVRGFCETQRALW